ncbi:MAG: T9SS type A sorting domain-containing protein [Flavobacteriales bacterium]|nr:T9SS type A sorting domain-containing protein [Flavobacteriales bacterium]
MLKYSKLVLVTAILFSSINVSFAARSPKDGKSAGSNGSPKGLAAECLPPATSIELDLNNVRARIHSGGDMWWDLQNVAKYEVPKNSGKHSLFAGSLWMGGVDVNGQLKVAANRFRASGNDYWTGPLVMATAEIDPAVCAAYDRFFPITRTEVDAFVAWFICSEDPDCDDASEYPGYIIPKSILEWPAHGDVGIGQDYNLAPYNDTDGSGDYNPEDGGDYPFYDLNPTDFDCLSEREVKLFGDETLWWVFNDKGNIHTETGANPIGMEIRGQAFAFSTNDEINDMTFYNYELINRGSFTLTETYFAQWVDVDIGAFNDDYVGCDVQRGLGYGYNGVAVDGTGAPNHYGANPPAIGVDFFQGPYQDTTGTDNPLYNNCEVSQAVTEGGAVYGGIGVGYGDGVIDNERFGMRRFIYHNSTGGSPAQQDPQTGADYYNYMRGIWLDGAPMCYGGTGHPSGGCNVGTLAGYMFPGDTDPCGWGTGGTPQALWTEQTAGNAPLDRRFMQSAGPFTLTPGAVNDITVGVVWARANNATDPFQSVELVRIADDKAQALFDNCFVLIDGPDAPELEIIELDRELVLTLFNPTSSNNANEDYAQVDPFIALDPPTITDNIFRFEGYQIFQLKDETVSSSELTNPDVARLVVQVDVENTDPLTGEAIGQLVNFTFSAELNGSIPVEMVNGANEGLKHSFQITQDQFALNDRQLVNHKKYYYMAVAYSYNNFLTYDQNNPNQLNGQKEPYLAGRKNAFGGAIVSIVGIPHITDPEQEGTVLSAVYGDGPRLTRVEGQGNGGRDLVLDQQTIFDIVESADGRLDTITYDFGRGPVEIKVVNPKNLPNADFVFKMHDSITPGDLEDAYWSLECIGEDCPLLVSTDLDSLTVWAEKPIGLSNGNEQIIPQWGLSVFLEQTIDPGDEDAGNGFIDGRITYGGSKFWLTGIGDVDGASALNWIRSGTVDGVDYSGDDDQVYETVLGGTWSPWKMASHEDSVMAPSWRQSKPLNKLRELASVDIVIVNNQDHWTRCPVVEIGDEFVPTIGNVDRFDLRMSPSVGKDGKPDGTGMGMGWFPGYAINVETGERLNMAFGENSWLQQSNGADMIWNPTDELFDGNFDPDLVNPSRSPIFGGGHYIYVFGHNDDSDNRMPSYDEGLWMYTKLANDGNFNPGIPDKRRAYQDAMWVGLPMLAPNGSMLESKVTINLRVTKPYREDFAPGWSVAVPQNDNLPMYTFSTKDFATVRQDLTTAEDALDLIKAVPNPYYANSGYELTQLDNIVKIINLPVECTISIYTINGTLVRQFKKDSPITSLDWDLKNHKNIPVASGVYIMHIDAPGIGEKVIRWFGTVRQQDLNSF